MGQHSAKFHETGGDSSGQLGSAIFFRRHRGGWFVLCRKESGGFFAAERLPRLGEMINDFINAVGVKEFCLPYSTGFCFVPGSFDLMKSGIFAKYLLISALSAVLSGCLTQRTVTSNGEVVSQGYVLKRPLQGAQ